MGYTGLTHWNDSDIAADVAHETMDAIAKVLKKALKVKENSFNTSGPENVAMILESFILPEAKKKGFIHDNIKELTQKTLEKIRETIEKAQKADWDYPENKKEHICSYRRMERNLNIILEACQ